MAIWHKATERSEMLEKLEKGQLVGRENWHVVVPWVCPDKHIGICIFIYLCIYIDVHEYMYPLRIGFLTRCAAEQRSLDTQKWHINIARKWLSSSRTTPCRAVG